MGARFAQDLGTSLLISCRCTPALPCGARPALLTKETGQGEVHSVPLLLSKTLQHRPQFQERPLPLGGHCTDQLPDPQTLSVTLTEMDEEDWPHQDVRPFT